MSKKNVVVSRAFLLKLADTIYNPKTKKFLRLCDGTLQNGPDPTNQERPMHCGLGELYFAVTGLQPETTGVDEDDVVGITLHRSTLCNEDVDAFETAKAAFRNLKLDPYDTRDTLDDLHNKLKERLGSNKKAAKVYKFLDILSDIPDTNDDNCGSEYCDDEVFLDRSKRVAKQLRAAAKLLPA